MNGFHRKSLKKEEFDDIVKTIKRFLKSGFLYNNIKFFQNKINDKVDFSGSTDVLKSFTNYEKIEVNRKNEQYLNILNKYIKDNPNILNIL
ncbi:hypothetical protein [Candidatus Williamhamiltonella defendens]|uniref:hypothetical protein n=1 Tax=Candidatus Williamhamiltonella defendens TaxID=138072 RepID=UPI00130E0F39|nr:hypothetical protein [Candidatus Hamiltonella defensa]